MNRFLAVVGIGVAAVIGLGFFSLARSNCESEVRGRKDTSPQTSPFNIDPRKNLQSSPRNGSAQLNVSKQALASPSHSSASALPQLQSPPAERTSTFRNDIARYGTRVIPYSRTGGQGWTIDFGNVRTKSVNGIDLELDQSRTVVNQGDHIVVRLVAATELAFVEVGSLRRATEGAGIVQREVPFRDLNGEKVDWQAAIPTDGLTYAEYRLDATAVGIDGAQAEVSYFFEVVRQPKFSNLGVVGSRVENGHIVVDVGVQSIRQTHVQVVARLSSAHGDRLAILRGEGTVRTGTSRLPVVIPGSFAEDVLSPGAYKIHDVEVLEVRSGMDVVRATPWRGSYNFLVPAGVDWNEAAPGGPAEVAKLSNDVQPL